LTFVQAFKDFLIIWVPFEFVFSSENFIQP
jgi:hypothetical protein